MQLRKLLRNKSWFDLLEDEFDKPYFHGLETFLNDEYSKEVHILPPEDCIFEALNSLSPLDVKVLILGQDPYHGINQAHGLSFSVQKGIQTPPSLKNIYKELKNDLNIDPINHGNLQKWTDQGVLLLNDTLTVELNKAGSHQKKGWSPFTDRIIEILNVKTQPMIFLLWGTFAAKKCSRINNSKHLILKTSHPSPLSAYRGFLGSKHFSQTNQFLISQKRNPINWDLS